ncbi:zinc finger protein 518B [Latimeria chalumnae]|uniref:zinc finger protein 518B n=1 Tax=Latimeria chalumnae TaxID=7897 RepID=UPI0003C1494B|nr:PREDICTED: zinc finger protein 518B-like [Latimeria chalumnae]XP_014343783.1 PREDICTED: zinc finger protein 518B-like [Latimeria chalumnae]XP_014343784.1 PREDICTED: zinc finger protein 518B-like [Latimeria chalumnae]XP_014343785.1 PREDICTED: zinc finger protein 518B-like [Latimeria chalumnae]XP_014343786.1 PREDICTED: zinc finger protein 518B-like [Latimeria chalumnae]XP_014343787.1 PREDICTED: zinc finger protein 518B-like [Latimeria chalumnae]XP_014343788.1 PREDICTED: zinc finger protein 5|eukprot:XP_005995865.1 PREDICTED: zinc finger protein 518B-like [Latimeria chalumnae]
MGNKVIQTKMQETKGEDDRMRLFCVECKNMRISTLEDLQRLYELKSHDQKSACNKFDITAYDVGEIRIDATSHFIGKVTDEESEHKEKLALNKGTEQFKVKDFKLVKYCCNKCQFTTKSTLQYWKHLLQHGDIKFTCSYCKNVSNAKSMFQRHLVIHSGTFPYKCEYGAVRNDYSMKCTKETHDTIKRKGQCVFQHRKQKKCFIKLNTTLDGQSERQKGFFQVDLDASVLPTEVSDPEQVQNCNADSLSSNSENFKFDFFVEELEESVKLSSSATVGDSVSLVGTENGKVQVEVLSPKQVPLLPGVTLTVVAPSEFVVPEKCLAQPVEVKTVNGIQQLVLNFIPQEDVYPEFLENNTREIESLSFEKALTDCTNKSSTYSQQNTLFFQAVKSHKEIGSESINSKPLHNFKSFEKHPDPVSLASEATGKEMPFKNIDDDPTLKPNLGSEVLYQKSIHDLDQGEVNVLKIDPRLKISVLDSKVISGPQKAVKETKHNFHNAAWERISSPTRSTSSGNLLQQCSAKDEQPSLSDDFAETLDSHDLSPSSSNIQLLSSGEKLCVGKPKKSIERTSYSSNPVVPSRLEKNTDIEGIPVQNGSNSPVKLGNDIDQVELYSNNKESSEFQSTDGGSTTEGPIIVSVFSLSGGINVPEQVRWMNEHSCDQDLESKASALFQRNFKTLDMSNADNANPLISNNLYFQDSPKIPISKHSSDCSTCKKVTSAVTNLSKTCILDVTDVSESINHIYIGQGQCGVDEASSEDSVPLSSFCKTDILGSSSSMLVQGNHTLDETDGSICYAKPIVSTVNCISSSQILGRRNPSDTFVNQNPDIQCVETLSWLTTNNIRDTSLQKPSDLLVESCLSLPWPHSEEFDNAFQSMIFSSNPVKAKSLTSDACSGLDSKNSLRTTVSSVVPESQCSSLINQETLSHDLLQSLPCITSFRNSLKMSQSLKKKSEMTSYSSAKRDDLPILSLNSLGSNLTVAAHNCRIWSRDCLVTDKDGDTRTCEKHPNLYCSEDVYLQQLSSGVAVVEKAQVSSFVTKEEKDNHEVKPRVPKNLASGIQGACTSFVSKDKFKKSCNKHHWVDQGEKTKKHFTNVREVQSCSRSKKQCPRVRISSFKTRSKKHTSALVSEHSNYSTTDAQLDTENKTLPYRAVRKNDASAASFHVASPIFIPKGTVLRVLDSCNDSVQSRPCAKSRKASFHSAYHEQMLLPRPVPFSTSEYLSTSVLHSANKAKTLATSNRANERLTKQTSKQNRNCKPIKQSGLVEAKIDSDLKSTEHTCLVKSANAEKVKNCTKRKQKYSEAEGVSKKKRLNDFSFDMMTKQIRLQPLKGNQLINDPQVIPNQPVVVLNRPDIDAPAVSNVMKTTSQNKSHAVKVGLSKRTKFCHRAKQHRQSKLTPQNCKVFISVKKWPMQNMKLKNPQKNNSQVVSSDSGQPFHCTFRCWFCGRIYFNQEEWITHGQRHLTEATKDWDVLCSELQMERDL